MFRCIAARRNYLQPDRPDIQFAVKECCRIMSRPTSRSWELLKRVGRYLKGRPRLVWKSDWQSPLDVLDVHSNANWAGCRESRKSSSGGTIAIGGHLIRTYTKTQSVITNYSEESELYAVVRVSTEGLGISTLLADVGCPDMRASVGMDANAGSASSSAKASTSYDTSRWMCSGCKSSRRGDSCRFGSCQVHGIHRTWGRSTSRWR